MLAHAEQLNVKLYFSGSTGPRLRAFLPVFHRWIREDQVPELAIDVADYSHMHHGPGVMLICDRAHYAIDEIDGERGLLYRKKRGEPDQDLGARIAGALGRALEAAVWLEADPDLGGQLRFSGDRLLLGFQDRLRAPNDDLSFEAFRPVLAEVLDRLYGVGVWTARRVGAPSETFAVRVDAPGAPGAAELAGRLR